MSITNTSGSYGTIAKSLHWITALGIVMVIPLGIIANGLPYDTPEQLALKAWLFSLHKTVGLTIFFAALLRIAWAVSQPKPNPLHPERRLETLLAEVVHWLLYGSLILVPLSGWVHHAATEGFAPIWWPFGQNLPLVPESNAVAEASAGLHIVFERVLVLSLLLHIAGALKHTVIDKDGTLARMWFGRTNAKAPAAKPGHGIAAGLAVVVWAAALSVGGMLGVYQKGSVAAAVALQEVESDWQVQEGALSITVKQLGADVRGEFADWTAQIDFDDSVSDGVAGSVSVEIAIASLSLGSVTNQAMGTDYFHVEAFPTSLFTADIVTGPDGYVAEGSLSLKDITQPVSLPFRLTLEGDTATIEGSTILNRQAFGVGDSMTDESQLGFEVVIDVALTAQRGG